MVYVDDILILSPEKSLIEEVKKEILCRFDGRELKNSKTFLGLEISRDRESKLIKLSQENAILKLVDKLGIEHGNKIPMKANVKLQKEGEILDTNTYPYNMLVGSLLYLSTSTRPDISFAVGVLSRYMANPMKEHWEAAIHVLKYLKSTAAEGIVYGGEKEEMKTYCDADYGGEVDTRKSTTGYILVLNGGAISWNSRLQPTVAVSSCEAEYMAAASVTKELLWYMKLLAEVRPNINISKVYCDNQGTINILKHPVMHSRSKHIDIIHKFVRERVSRGEITFEYISTTDMIADCLTKALPGPKLSVCKKGMGMAI